MRTWQEDGAWWIESVPGSKITEKRTTRLPCC
jgi:hypothetical protein